MKPESGVVTKKVVRMGGPDLARAMMTSTLLFDGAPRLTAGPKTIKPTSTQRRAAKIAAGRLRVVDGQLQGGPL